MATSRRAPAGPRKPRDKKPAGPRPPRRTARRVRREEAARGSIFAAAAALDPAALEPRERAVAEAVQAVGGALLAAFRDPLAGRPLLLAMLPLDRVEPTEYQRPVSPAHAERLADAIARTGQYLDPIIAFCQRGPDGAPRFHTPNGGHRSEAMRAIGARAITALLVPDPAIAWRILALNTEKAHNLKERSAEVAGMARALAPLGGSERDYAAYFEEPALLTIGLAYGKRPRLSGAVWYPLVRRLEDWSDKPLAEALAAREAHADELLALDETVGELVAALKARGLQSPYLRAFVVARLNPLRFAPAPRGKARAEARTPSWTETFERMRKAAGKFDPARVDPSHLASSAGGPPPAEDED